MSFELQLNPFTAEENAALKAQLSSLSETQSSSSTEVEALKHQVEEVEREKRDLLSVISRSKQDESQRDGMSFQLAQRVSAVDSQQRRSSLYEIRSKRPVKSTSNSNLESVNFNPPKRPPSSKLNH